VPVFVVLNEYDVNWGLTDVENVAMKQYFSPIAGEPGVHGVVFFE
jgi:hypothetical protein